MPVSVTEQYCECALSAYKLSLRNLISNCAQIADDACEQKSENGTLDVVDQQTQHLYSMLIGHRKPPSITVGGETTLHEKCVSAPASHHWRRIRDYSWGHFLRCRSARLAARYERASAPMFCVRGYRERIFGFIRTAYFGAR